jgi:predicted DNA-binding protein YlxM (UPF0122 family)
MPKALTENEKKLMQLTYTSDFNGVFNDLLLSDRQKQIFQLYYGNKWRMLDIACELDICERTVSDELKIIAYKLENYQF